VPSESGQDADAGPGRRPPSGDETAGHASHSHKQRQILGEISRYNQGMTINGEGEGLGKGGENLTPGICDFRKRVGFASIELQTS